MKTYEPISMLLLASYCKGERFMRQAHARGRKLYVLTTAANLSNPWPRECIEEVWAKPDECDRETSLRIVGHLARTRRFDRIVALDDLDVELAATLREHLRIPGMGDTTARHFRDKLAMRTRSREMGIPIPEFVRAVNDEEISDFAKTVAPPWMLKPRGEASAAGIIKIESEAELWPALEAKGDARPFFLLEGYLPGEVFHVDSIVSEREVVFAEVSRYAKPPFNVAHGGGIFISHTVDRASADAVALRELNAEVLTKLNLVRGVSHTEYIKSHADGRFYMLETSARVGGAYISDVIEAASGVNLWQEWANIEVDEGRIPYELPKTRRDEYAGIALTLARQEQPDTSAYDDPEIVYRVAKPHHAGLIVRSKDPARIEALLSSYGERFANDFSASLPSPDRLAR